MKQLIACFAAIALLHTARAEDVGDSPVKHMKPPKGVTLTPEQEKLLEDGNRYLESGYKLLMDKQDPEKAVEELRRAYVIANQLSILKEKALLAGVMPGNEIGTPHDKIETEGGIERIVEISAAIGVGAPPEVDNGLYKRKIVKKATEEAKKLETEQRQLSEQIRNLGGGGGDKQKPPQNPQQQQQQQQDPLAKENANANPQAQPDAKAQPGEAQANANSKEQSGAKEAQAAAQANANGQAQPDAKAQPGETKANANPQGQPDPTAQQGGADDLARRQEAVAVALHKIATELTPAGKADPAATKAAQAFRKAADAASHTAQMLRNNQVDAAADASRQAERAIGEAQAAAGAAENQNQAETLAAIRKQIDGVETAQQRILGQTQQIHRNADGTNASEGVQKDRATALAIEEGKLKPQVESIQNALKALAENPAAGPANSAQNAAREETANAAEALQQGRARQGVVNATMKLANGEPATAATAMAQIQNALAAARQHVAAADTALAGKNARLEQEYRQIQQVAAALRRLEQNAQNALKDGQNGAPGTPPTNPAEGAKAASKPAEGTAQNQGNASAAENKAAEKGQPATNDATKAEHAHEAAADKVPDSASGAVSASWGAVLNHSAEQIQADLRKLAPDLAAADAEAAQQIGALAGKKTAFERDREGSLGQVRALLGAVEKVELELAHKVAGDDERKALRNYRKDEIPLPYRKAVASYYEELSKDQK